MTCKTDAPHFKSTKNIVGMAWEKSANGSSMHTHLNDQRVKWSSVVGRWLLNWIGGFYELLAGTTKITLNKGFGRVGLTISQL